MPIFDPFTILPPFLLLISIVELVNCSTVDTFFSLILMCVCEPHTCFFFYESKKEGKDCLIRGDLRTNPPSLTLEYFTHE